MTTAAIAEEVTGHARYTFRLRVSKTALAQLEDEWSKCRWVWNECVAMSRKVHRHSKATGEKTTCGPSQLDKMLTEARGVMSWLRKGSSVPQQQIIRDFAKSRTKALKDIKAKLPMRQRAGMPKPKKKREALPSLNYSKRGFRLKDGRLHLASGIVLTVVWSRDLPSDPTSVRVYRDSLGHWYCSFVVSSMTEALPETGRAIGIDWGVRETATTTSDAHDLPHAQHGKTAAQKLARYQRMMARSLRGSLPSSVGPAATGRNPVPWRAGQRATGDNGGVDRRIPVGERGIAMSEAILRFDSLLCERSSEDPGDEVIMHVDGRKVWPGDDGGYPMSSGAEIGFSKDFLFRAAYVVVALYDHDVLTPDDDLGSISIPADEAGTGSHTRDILGPGSHYKLKYRVGKIQF
ncbi:RNA-guided endonuclease InsQ/TnpB family protein [Streptomyces sp. NPDC048337]|uniref:RNA-guided endonuclease InsQ/TnpB family protein n=1 Tax=Streptomyces sp. NPDC048337 TaxID=3365535 RepID=UPI003712576C